MHRWNYGITTVFAVCYQSLIYADPWFMQFEEKHTDSLRLVTAEDLAIIRLTGGFVEY